MRQKKSVLFVLVSVLLLSLFRGAAAAEGPYLYGATQYGGKNTVEVRLQNPSEAALVLGVYDRAAHQLKAWHIQTAAAGAQRHILTVTLDEAPGSTEYVKAFLLTPEDLRPLCIPVLADYVIPYPEGGDDGEEEPPDTEEDPSELAPGTEEDPGAEEDPPEPDPGREEEEDPSEPPEPEDGKIYATPSGKKYHYDPGCGGKNSYETTWEEIRERGLEPCSKCVK